jgi:protein O-mannosyl-transferase
MRAATDRPARPSHRQPDQPVARQVRWLPVLVAVLLVAGTLAAYFPAWRGGILWDDEKHLTRVELQGVDGLVRIWTELGATQQYYPVVHSAFWLQHRLWGDNTLGYHLVNILLHACSAWLLFLILRRLGVPGALLAAGIFALHPIQAESVAWMTELKNTLSGVFFLLAALAYLRFDRERTGRAYLAAAACFLLALLSKSVTATLPGVLLVLAWWQRGHLDWRRDIRPLVPFIGAGAAAGLLTAWVERTYIGAEGSAFSLTIIERTLLAGRACWFYLASFAWPASLSFIYPRWSISPSEWWQYVFPLGIAMALVTAWVVRRRTRAPLAALLVFGGILFPVLGFFNVYPFRFSYVADHFQYLACIPVITMVAAGSTTLQRRWWSATPAVGVVLAAVWLAVYGGLTFRHSYDYTDAVTSYRATLATNPTCWLAHANLGAMLRRSAPAEALAHLTDAVRLEPTLVEAHYNLAATFQDLGRVDDAAAQFRETIALAPGHARAFAGLGNALRTAGQLDDAERAYRDAIRLSPDLAIARSGLGRVLQDAGRLAEARQACDAAVRLQPALAPAHRDLAAVLLDLGLADAAVAEYDTALRLGGPDASVLAGACAALRAAGRPDDARQACDAAVTAQPSLALAQYERANLLTVQGHLADAVASYRQATALAPGEAELHCALAVALQAVGQAGASRDEMDRALDAAPDEAAAHTAMARALEAQQRFDVARVEWEEVLRLQGDAPVARAALARIGVMARPRR